MRPTRAPAVLFTLFLVSNAIGQDALLQISSGNSFDTFGHAIAGVGDVNGDSKADVTASSLNLNSGFAQVLSGGCGKVTAYGAGCPGAGGVTPAMIVSGCATPQGTLNLAFSSGPPSGAALLFTGLIQTAVPMAGGCTLYVAPLIGPFGPLPLSASGAGSFDLALPGSVTGLTVTLQAFFPDAGVPHGFSNSGGSQVEFE